MNKSANLGQTAIADLAADLATQATELGLAVARYAQAHAKLREHSYMESYADHATKLGVAGLAPLKSELAGFSAKAIADLQHSCVTLAKWPHLQAATPTCRTVFPELVGTDGLLYEHTTLLRDYYEKIQTIWTKHKFGRLHMAPTPDIAPLVAQTERYLRECGRLVELYRQKSSEEQESKSTRAVQLWDEA